ncbi:golgin subfamily A member 8H-like isoform X3 [Pongo abelii]|uniref:golgin subfamily A member 8H-like isoform X5 n=1 Tax=Pongo abelii TaxID=9601 RepID=UPI0023E34021|nr:golgin subfamily A member 8H-like isoform X4 [Pongo pygmaeus]XP_054388061.1 golgin subfamily A member 8H-like isoform X4 [Pongo abelii]XP_054388225.1 golgin subfamily A member 8H-like isoform X7 [Pongo abelii]XP_054388240.1 golgin subfamily A member 8H-like isoform X5 [Pongo abelii]XP_054401807.1 golgin subfamily A member 8H-like isoform X4 [Pongo abelii]
MAEETQQNKLAAAKKKLKEYWQKNSPRVPAGVNRNRKTNGSIPETATSGGCQSPGDSARDFHREGPTSSATLKDLESPCQELAVVLDSRSVKISQLKNTIKALKQQKKQVEHQLEEEKKANNKKQKAERELEVQIQTLNIQKGKLNTHLYHMKRSLRYFEEESKDLAIHLQHSLQRKRELEQALSAVTTTQKKKANQFSSHSKARMEWKLEHSIQEQALLKAQVTQLKESFKQAQLERDECVQHLKGERARWQQRMRKMSQEVCTLKNEKKNDMRRIEKLERSLSKLKNQMAEPLPPEPPEPPAMSSKVELQHLRKELERVAGELQAQVKNNQRISLLNRGQEERIQVQEERLRKQEERLEEQQERLQQLAKPQSIFEELEHLEATSQQNQQLTTQLSLMALPGEGDGGGHLDSEEEEAPRPMPSISEDLEGREAMSGFMDHLEEKADLSELVNKQELRFIHYWRERCHQKIHHVLTEPGGSAKDAALGGGHHQAGPGQGGDEGEAAGAAADGIAAYSNYNNGHRKFLAAAQNPADEPGPGAPAPQELGAADKQGDLCEVSLTSSAQGEAREGPLYDNPTTQPIVQDHQEHPGLGSNCCVPFFCWAWLLRRRR